MAQKIRYVSDLSDTDLGENDAPGTDFAWGGKSYRVDLTRKEYDKFDKALAELIAVAHRVSGATPTVRARKVTAANGGSGRTATELAEIRAWAKDQGMPVSERGRIAGDVLAAYDAEH